MKEIERFNMIVAFVTNNAKEFYRHSRWKFYTRGLDKISTTGGAEWVRQLRGWELFLVDTVEFEPKTAVIDLLRGLGEIGIMAYIGSHKNGQLLLSNLAFLAQNGFSFSMDEIKVAVTSPPQKGNDNHYGNIMAWPNDVNQCGHKYT